MTLANALLPSPAPTVSAADPSDRLPSPDKVVSVWSFPARSTAAPPLNCSVRIADGSLF